MHKSKILVFIDWFTPAYKAGGPIKSVNNIINSLYNEFEFDIITSNHDMGEETALENIEIDCWSSCDKYRIIYLSPKNRQKFIKDHLQSKSYDYIYFNSAFSKNFTLKPLRLINKFKLPCQVVLAPRGMFGKGALAIKPLKKKLFLAFAKNIGLYRNVRWHATNEIEKNNISAVFGKNIECKIAGNISVIRIKKVKIQKVKNKVDFVFFSRISPKKNIRYALELLAELNNSNIKLDVYGPIEDNNYWQQCNKIIKQNKLQVNFKGSIGPEEVQDTLLKYHFFILPTQHENFGHVIVEALVSGCGLIISDQTPWIDLESQGIGWDIPLTNHQKWISVINQCLMMSEEEYIKMRENCFQFVQSKIDDKKEISATRKLFSQKDSEVMT